MNPLDRVVGVLQGLGFSIEYDSLKMKHDANSLTYPLAIIDCPFIDIEDAISSYHFSIYLLNPSDAPIRTHLAMTNAAGRLQIEFNVPVRSQEIVHTQNDVSGSLVEFIVKQPFNHCE